MSLSSAKHLLIDGHAHACGMYLTSESLTRYLDQYGVYSVVLVPGELNSAKTYDMPDVTSRFPDVNLVKVANLLAGTVTRLAGATRQIPAGNQFVAELAAQCPERVIQFVWMTMGIADPIGYLDRKYVEWKFMGIKLHQCWESFKIDSPYFECIAGWAEARDLPLFIHLWSDREVRKLIDYKRRHPHLKLIVAHLFGMELFIRANLKDDNLFFDLSSFQLVSAKRILKAVEFFGAEKLLMGTDTPYGKDNLKGNLDRIQGLPITEEQKHLILGDNMKRLLGIDL
ncbi:MAG: amidohydrolase family protein [Chloroflexota bacterium]|nr:amidohydrolase family protein [Anaerolineales bacterium]